MGYYAIYKKFVLHISERYGIINRGNYNVEGIQNYGIGSGHQLFCGGGIFETLAITFRTIFYHFGIRLLIGAVFNAVMNNKADYTKKLFHIRPWEHKLYKILKVKKWKDKLLSYHPDSFSPKEHTWDEIAQTMCQSECVHITNAVVSFVPVIFSKLPGAFYVFLITSICAAVFDLIFVIIQRYNRDIVIKAALRKQRRKT